MSLRTVPALSRFGLIVSACLTMALSGRAEVTVDMTALGESLGGWRKCSKKAAEYSLSGTDYRTYKPEVSPTPEAGIFVSLRIDNMRGWLSSDDHAVLEITVNSEGIITSAKSNVAIQGRSIASDVIFGTNESSKKIAEGKSISPTDRAVQIGADLVTDLSGKLLRENLVEPGRVSFPAVLRHNYNLLFKALRLDGKAVQPLIPVLPPPAKPSAPADKDAPPVAKPVPGNASLEVSPYATPSNGNITEKSEKP